LGIASHLRCNQIVELASDYLERALAGGDAERLEQHLLICGGCAEYVAQLGEVVARAAQLRPSEPEQLDAATEAQLLSALRSWKRGGDP
jgi:predicted anti-sigma-YlaC factor YlaD